jgi:tRNA-specific 2-thiouridylase
MMFAKNNSRGETVCVGLSGGVDSSVVAVRLIEQGYNVIGVFIKTWQPDFLVCNWEQERLDAMRVAAHLGIPFYTCDAEETYKQDVADYMIREYTAGRTPNPDVMCNKFVKFGAFLTYAIEHGATKVATGHYARVTENNGQYQLHRGVDIHKDQSYFLWTLTQTQLSHTLFPVGDTAKRAIRTEAETAGLLTYAKSDSQGICFLGQVDIQEFLSHYIQTTQGHVLDETGKCIGTHEGALFYTMGQRHGFVIDIVGVASLPHYVVDKNLLDNTITVSTKQKQINGQRISLTDINLIGHENSTFTCEAQFRYRQKPFHVEVTCTEEGHGMLTVLTPDIELPSVGQSCVFYLHDICLGGGIIDNII